MQNPVVISSQPKQTKKRFSPTEDALLFDVVRRYGERSWTKIAEMIPGKTGRQCRERYKFYLKPTIINGPWSREEDELLEKLVNTVGPRWVEISKSFPGRSDINLKNRWYSRQRSIKAIEKISSVSEDSTYVNHESIFQDIDFDSLLNFGEIEMAVI